METYVFVLTSLSTVIGSNSCDQVAGASQGQRAATTFAIEHIISFALAIDARPLTGYLLIFFSAEAIVAYSAPKGGEMSAMTGGARFEDLTYDGYMNPDGVFVNGLGQLTDSFLGPNDFELADILDTSGE